MKAESPRFNTDFHSHILPDMDDGAADISASLAQLRILRQQGITRVFATPHFYLFQEQAEEFLARRADRLEQLQWAAAECDLPEVRLGAEVCIYRGLVDCVRLPELCYAGTDRILLEIPYTGYQDWMAEEICNLCYRYRLRPVLAHLDRFVDSLSDRQMEALLSLDDLVIQLNNSSFSRREGVRLAAELLGSGYDLLCGSDTHNLTTRRPDFDIANRALSKKLKPSAMEEWIARQTALFAESQSGTEEMD